MKINLRSKASLRGTLGYDMVTRALNRGNEINTKPISVRQGRLRAGISGA